MSKVINSLIKTSSFGKIDLDPKKPGKKKPIPAPDVDDDAKKRAESRRQQRMARSGRTSTVLTGGSNTLG